ncbi:MAG: host-nuclease inhibitor Gam family protein [Rhizomicrobium sp.]
MAAKTKTKSKSVPLAVPQNDDEANAALAAYGEAFNAVAAIEAAMNDELAKVKAAAQLQAFKHAQTMKQEYERLSLWGAANRKRLTKDGATKTVELPAGAVFWRDQPAKVSIKKSRKIDDVIAQIKELGMRRFLRPKYELNKDAMLADKDGAELLDGVTIKSAGEKFYVAPFGAEIVEGDE